MILEAVKTYPVTVVGPRGVLVQEGQKTGRLYVLKSGDLEIVRDGSLVASLGEPGLIVGEMSVLLGTENTATVKAEKPTTVRVVADALAYLERQPLVALRVAMLLSQRLDATSALLVELSKSSPQKAAEQSVFARLMSALVTPGADRG